MVMPLQHSPVGNSRYLIPWWKPRIISWHSVRHLVVRCDLIMFHYTILHRSHFWILRLLQSLYQNIFIVSRIKTIMQTRLWIWLSSYLRARNSFQRQSVWKRSMRPTIVCAWGSSLLMNSIMSSLVVPLMPMPIVAIWRCCMTGQRRTMISPVICCFLVMALGITVCCQVVGAVSHLMISCFAMRVRILLVLRNLMCLTTISVC